MGNGFLGSNATRCFIGVELEPHLIGLSQKAIGRLKQTVHHARWLSADQMHVTVKYLGEVDNRDLLQVCQVMRRACEGLAPFDLALDGLGTFPKGKPPRVVWARVAEGVEQLAGMYEFLDRELAALGIPQEGRAYTPHLTLGRLQPGNDLAQLENSLQTIARDVVSRCTIEGLALFTSERLRGDFVYEVIDKAPF